MFEYPSGSRIRRHGPRGYHDYRSYKPWLRDEFDFCCVYCRRREVWSADGQAAFGVEHLRSKRVNPDLINEYSNLLYACCRCNSFKQDFDLPLDPCRGGFGNPLEIDLDGKVQGKTTQGEILIELC